MSILKTLGRGRKTAKSVAEATARLGIGTPPPRGAMKPIIGPPPRRPIKPKIGPPPSRGATKPIIGPAPARTGYNPRTPAMGGPVARGKSAAAAQARYGMGAPPPRAPRTPKKPPIQKVDGLFDRIASRGPSWLKGQHLKGAAIGGVAATGIVASQNRSGRGVDKGSSSMYSYTPPRGPIM